jgi:RND family efflux transporter, MFP subunit
MKQDNISFLSKILLLLFFVGIIFSCKNIKNIKSREASSSNLPDISVAYPIIRDAIIYKEYPGYLSAVNSAKIIARVDGYIDRVCYLPGQRVNSGDLLFVIEPTLYANAVEQAQANLNSSIAEYNYLSNNYERIKEAAQSDAVSKIDVIQSNAQVLEAKANIDNAKAQLSTAKTNLNYCYVKAPFSGRVTVNPYGEGTYVGGSAQPVTLASIFDDSKMFANFSIADNLYVTPNMLPDSITISFNAVGDKSYPAKIDYESPNVELSTGTINIRAILPNDGSLKDGLYVTIKLPYKKIKNAILVSNASLGVNQAGKYLYVVNDSSVVNIRQVNVLSTVDDSLSIISEGLEPTDRYVTKAMLKVREGMKIKPCI